MLSRLGSIVKLISFTGYSYQIDIHGRKSRIKNFKIRVPFVRILINQLLSKFVCLLVFFFCGQSAVLRPSVHVARNLVVRRRSSAIPHSLLVVDSSCSHNWCLCFRQMDSPGGCGGPSVPLLCNGWVQSPWCQFASDALAGHSVLFTTWI